MDKKVLRKLANSYKMFDGKVTVWMMAMVTLRHNMVVDEIKELFGAEDSVRWFRDLNRPQQIFYLVEGNIVDLECEDIDEDDKHLDDIRGLKTYFENRNGNCANNWEYFKECNTWGGIAELNTAYNETRRKIPEIDNEILSEPPPDIQTDPKETGSGRKRTKKKSATT